jgi:hypothetical protein
MAATDYTATRVVRKIRVTLGHRVLVCAELTGDGTMTTISAGLMGLAHIDSAWTQDVDDAANLLTSTYAGSTVVVAVITATKKQLLFCIGY